jgi:hypothetical protein
MELSIFLSKFVGIYMLIIATIWLVRKKQFEAGVRSIISSNGLFSLTGAIHLIVGLTMAISHSLWELNWRGLITLLAYVAIFQGVFRLAFPEQAKQSTLQSLEKGYWIWLLFLFVVGIILTFNGFIHHGSNFYE